MRMSSAVVLMALLAACGGGGGGGGNAGGGSGSPPAARVFDSSSPPIVPIDCTHQGVGREFNVGGPSGSANRVENINDVAFDKLEPGDTVRIHWRPKPYAERLVIFRSGTEASPIKICGVRGGPKNSRPIITGFDAISPTAAVFNDGSIGFLQPYGIVTISGEEWGQRVEHVSVEGLRVGDTRTETNAVPEFVSATGERMKYSSAAACFRIQQAKHITLRGNEITNCSDGVFAGSKAESESHLVRNLVLEGNYLHGNAVIGDESRHQAYLQGMDFTVQGNYFGPVRSMPGIGVAMGNQLKTRVAGLVVRYNYFINGARMLDIVEAEEHIAMLAPWLYAEHSANYLGCQRSGCLRLSPEELAEYDQRQREDWLKYQTAHVYGNLMHVKGRDDGVTTYLPTNLVHYCFDNSQHDRQAGVLWFFHNTVLWETDRDNFSEVRLFDCGSDFGDGGYYGLNPSLKNVGDKLHYLTRNNGNVCQQPEDGCTDWGPMQQTVQEEFGRMRAFNNALIRKSFTPEAEFSETQLTRYLWDQLELVGANFITEGWDVDLVPDDGSGGGYGQRPLPATHVYEGGNAAHHVTGVENVFTGVEVPINIDTFAPVPGGKLKGRATLFDDGVDEDLHTPRLAPQLGRLPGQLLLKPRNAWSTVGAIE